MTTNKTIKALVLASTFLVPGSALAANIGGSQITQVTTTIGSGGSRFPLSQINDGNDSDASPFNGYAGAFNRTGTITMTLNQPYDLTAFRLWNDINVRVEGVKNFRLELIDNNGNSVRTLSNVAASGQVPVQSFAINPLASNIKTVKLHVDSLYHGQGIKRVEIREVEFSGTPHKGDAGPGNDGKGIDSLIPTFTAQCLPCFSDPRRKPNVYMSGLDDNFAGGNTETTSPRALFNSINSVTGYNSPGNTPGITRDYDEGHQNEFLIDTINVPNASQIQKGWIVLRSRDKGGLVSTDTFSFGDIAGWYNYHQTNGSGADKIHARAYGKKYADFQNELGPYNGQVWNYNSSTGIYYASLDDIKLTSDAHGGTSSLLQQIKQDGFADILIQDDTEVDFVAIVTCQPREKGKTYLSRNEAKGFLGNQIGRPLPKDTRKIFKRFGAR